MGVAKQRGSRILWDGVDAGQPPAYFDHMFHFTDPTRSAAALLLAKESLVDLSYLDESMSRMHMDSIASKSSHSSSSYYGDSSSNDGGDVDDSTIRRRRSHVARLSASVSYTHEQLMVDLFEAK